MKSTTWFLLCLIGVCIDKELWRYDWLLAWPASGYQSAKDLFAVKILLALGARIEDSAGYS